MSIDELAVTVARAQRRAVSAVAAAEDYDEACALDSIDLGAIFREAADELVRVMQNDPNPSEES